MKQEYFNFIIKCNELTVSFKKLVMNEARQEKKLKFPTLSTLGKKCFLAYIFFWILLLCFENWLILR